MHNVNSMMYAGEKPWHGLGTKVDSAQTSAEAIIAAELNWGVKKEIMYLKNGNEVPDSFAVVREDVGLPIGVVGNVYTPLQNKEAFSFFDAVVGEKAAMYHTAGALGKGEVVWLLAKLPGYIRTLKDDITEKYLLLTNSHNGSSPVKIMFTPIRVVCQNTLNIALAGNDQIAKIRHCSTMGEKIDYVRETIGIVSAQFSMFEELSNVMAKTQINNDGLKNYLYDANVIPKQKEGEKQSTRAYNIMEEVSGLFEKGRGSDMKSAKGTVWGAFNAVAEYVDYVRSSKNDARTKSLLIGSGASMKQRAWDTAVTLIK